MSDLHVRRAAVGDAEALAAVYRSAYRENWRLGFPAKAESATTDEVAEWIENYRMYVAEAEGEVVGGVRLTESDPERIKLSRLGVHEDRKGEGVGSQLVAHTEDVVRDRDYATVWLTTPREHPYLPEFYRDRGYERTGPYPLEFRRYDEIVMEKRLR